MIKRILASITALTLAIGLLPIVYADDPSADAGTASAGPEVTVVGKRITGDDTYFEISLEVNGDYEDYSSVGVVLQYDPELIVPAESWDDGAAAADMSGCTSWATRRALPTLGKDTWTTHTALTYIEETTDDASGAVTKTGYLYLGAEYPGVLPNNSNAYATPDPDATPAPTDETVSTPVPTPQVTPDPSDPYNNPVVVARFMYASDTAKAEIEQRWTSAWNADWTQNEILTIASNDISLKSPAQFGFAYYYSDFTMKGFEYAAVSANPTATAAPSFLDANEKAQSGDIEIILTEGKSAKSGGLSLSDIYVVLFYDWDDSLLGTFTCGVGVDSSADINEYVKTKFIHPELQNNTNYSSTARIDNYRGEYPSAGPNSTDPTTPGGTGSVTDGGDYPLTNKLEYCFAGRDFYTDADGNPLPFVGGWTKVAADTMEDTWTALDGSENFAQKADLDGDEIADVDADGNFLDANGNVIDMVSVDFSDVTANDLENGTLSVKAVYTPGEMLDIPNNFYTTGDSAEVESIGTISNTDGTYRITFQYKRINSSGYGVSRARELKTRMDTTQNGATLSFPMAADVENNEVIDVEFTPSKAVQNINYKLVDVYGTNLLSGSDRSASNGLGVFEAITSDRTGFIFQATKKRLIQTAYNSVKGINTKEWTTDITFSVLQDLDLRATAAGTVIANVALANAAKVKLLNCIRTAINSYYSGECPLDLTYYQLQYFILLNKYADATTAETYCKTNCTWLK